jgi:hypothetical protein
MQTDHDQIKRYIAEHGVTKLPPGLPAGAPGPSRWNPGAPTRVKMKRRRSPRSARAWLEANDPDYRRRQKAKLRRERAAKALVKRNPARFDYRELRSDNRP